MAISPQVLESIRNPTGGKLGQIGETYRRAKKAGIENTRAEEKMQMARDAATAATKQQSVENMYKEEVNNRAKEVEARNAQNQKMKMAELGSKAMGAYSTSVLDAVNNDPSIVDDPDRFAKMQSDIYNSFPDEYKEFIPEDTQSYEEIQRGLKNADAIQSRLNPTSTSPVYEMASIQNVKTGEVRSRIKNDPYLEKQIGTNDWVKYSPSTMGTSGDANLQKSTKGKIEVKAINAAELQDQIAGLSKLMKSGGTEKLNVFSQAKDFASNFAETLGMDLSEPLKDDVEARAKIKGHVDKVYTSWRKLVTGSQASKFELKEIKSQAPNMDDGETKFMTKLGKWKNDADAIAVRMKKASNEGFYQSGTIKTEGGDEIPLFKNKETGETRSITDFGALGAIPTMEEFEDSYLDENYPDPTTMSVADQKKARADATAKARMQGYR